MSSKQSKHSMPTYDIRLDALPPPADEIHRREPSRDFISPRSENLKKRRHSEGDGSYLQPKVKSEKDRKRKRESAVRSDESHFYLSVF
jgi:hypothetical protein